MRQKDRLDHIGGAIDDHQAVLSAAGGRRHRSRKVGEQTPQALVGTIRCGLGDKLKDPPSPAHPSQRLKCPVTVIPN